MISVKSCPARLGQVSSLVLINFFGVGMARFMKNLKTWLWAPASSVIRNRSLIIELSKREVLGRYRGASFGLFGRY